MVTILIWLLALMWANGSQCIEPGDMELAAKIVCSGKDSTRYWYILEYHLSSSSDTIKIDEDMPFEMSVYFISGENDTTPYYSAHDVRYNFGIKDLGSLIVPCDTGYVPLEGRVNEGRYYIRNEHYQFESATDITMIVAELNIHTFKMGQHCKVMLSTTVPLISKTD
ncbi:hypothetical protein ACFL5M_06945 [Candidatus Neomarinimicrobiota bacterium]